MGETGRKRQNGRIESEMDETGSKLVKNGKRGEIDEGAIGELG